MTGTALDGFTDVAMVETDGLAIQALGAWRLEPYGEALRMRLADAVALARAWDFEGRAPERLRAAERDYTLAQAQAVRALVAQAGVPLTAVDVVGLHGLTLLHRPDAGRTLQLGDGALLARELGVRVAYDLRSADMAAGGQGAPIAPVYHAALMRHAGIAAPAAALNLGGVANITWWGGGERVIAFDTGPANGPINEWMERHGRGPFDRDGACAGAGRVDEARLARLLAHPYFAQAYPKSLDRFDFNAALADGLSLEDGAATLTALSAAAVARAFALLPARPRDLIVCGGGRKNPVLMRELTQRCGVAVRDCDEAGWRGDAVEAEAVAFIAARALIGAPYTFPQTTGAPQPMSGGRIADPARA